MQCGLGGDRRQAEGMGTDLKSRVGRFEASLAIMRALWAGETVTAENPWSFQGARISPQPPQPVDVWIGSQADVAIRRTARLAEGWLASPGLLPDQAADAIARYRQSCAEFNREPTAVAIRRDIYVGSSAEEARQVVQPYIDAGYRGFSEESLITGSVEAVAEQFAELAGMGYTDVIVRNISADQKESLACIERLADVKRLL
jgi:alkanesulfonate monooxygenase SsuD/methylene tetrahydromethanopterin reductase-like flavin-dependent oxidoreductase (luciferase family)